MEKDNLAVRFHNLYDYWEKHLELLFPQDDKFHAHLRFFTEYQRECLSNGISENDLTSLLYIRNALYHRPSFINLKEPILELLEKTVKLFCLKARDIATPSDKIYTARPQDEITKIITTMRDRDYTYVPVIDEDFKGIFSPWILLKLVVEESGINALCIEDIITELNSPESTRKFTFLQPETPLHEVIEIFQVKIQHGERLEVVFLTDHGKKSPLLKGLITAWDLNKDVHQLVRQRTVEQPKS